MPLKMRVVVECDSMQEYKDFLVKSAGDLLAYGLVPKFKNSDAPEGLIQTPTAKVATLSPEAEAKVEAAIETHHANETIPVKRKPGRPPKSADIAADMKTEETKAAQVVDIEPKQVATPAAAPATPPVATKTHQSGVVERDGMLQALNQVFVKKGVNRLKELFKTMNVPGHNSITTPEQVSQAIKLANEALES